MSAYPARTMAELAYTFESAARPGQHIDEIATPALLVDPDRMERNIAHFQALADANAIKSASAHQDAHGAGDRADADRRPRRRHHVRQDRRDRGLRRRRFDDIVVAYPVFGEYKWRRLAERPGARGGVAHHDLEEVKQVADTTQSTAGSGLVGLTTDRQIFFAGASGSIVHKGAARTPGITELRAVPYVFCDLMELGSGSAAGTISRSRSYAQSSAPASRAARRSTTARRRPAATAASSGSRSRTSTRSRWPPGAICHVDPVTEEHGIVVVGAGERASLGEKIRFYPTHACTAVNLSDHLIGCRGELVEVAWPVMAHGKRT